MMLMALRKRNSRLEGLNLLAKQLSQLAARDIASVGKASTGMLAAGSLRDEFRGKGMVQLATSHAFFVVR
jgi:hypothetical protein